MTALQKQPYYLKFVGLPTQVVGMPSVVDTDTDVFCSLHFHFLLSVTLSILGMHPSKMSISSVSLYMEMISMYYKKYLNKVRNNNFLFFLVSGDWKLYMVALFPILSRKKNHPLDI